MPEISASLQQAQVAYQCQDWSRLIQYLQQALVEPNNVGLNQPEQTQWLDLALTVLAEGDFQNRWDVAKVFPQLGTDAIAPLITILQDEDTDWECQWFVVRILGEFQHPDAISAVIDLLQTTANDELSALAAEALTKLGTPAIAALTALLTQDQTRGLAVRSLCQIRHSETIQPLLSVINDPDPGVRVAVIEALSSFRNPQIPPVLVNALSDPVASVRRCAVVGLGLRADLAQELDLVNRLSEKLWDFNLEVCQGAAMALGRLGTPTATAALLKCLNAATTPTGLKIEIVRSLSWIGTVTTLNGLQQALSSAGSQPGFEDAVYQEIIAALGRVESPNLKPLAAQILVTVLTCQDSPLQDSSLLQSAVLALGQLQVVEALEALIPLLAHADQGVRLHTIAALKKLAPHTAQQQLSQLAQQDNLTPELRNGVLEALQEW